MSKRSHQQSARNRKQRQRKLMAFGIAGVILALVAGGLLIAFASTGSDKPSVPVTVSGAPRLTIDRELIDFGDVPMGKMVTASFNLSNTGDQPLTISHPPVPEVVQGC